MWGLSRTVLYSFVKKLEVEEEMTNDDCRYRLTVSEMVFISGGPGVVDMELSDGLYVLESFIECRIAPHVRCRLGGGDQGIMTNIFEKQKVLYCMNVNVDLWEDWSMEFFEVKEIWNRPG